MDFTPEQLTEIDKLTKKAVDEAVSAKEKELKETLITKETELSELKTKNDELAKGAETLNNQIIDGMFKAEGIELNSTQMSFIKQTVKKFDANNLDEIKSKSLELVGKKVDFKKSKGNKEDPIEKEFLNVSDPLGLLE